MERFQDRSHELQAGQPDLEIGCRVRIIEDARSEESYGPHGNLSGHFGHYIGSFAVDSWKVEAKGVEILRSDAGDIIWGDQCYWVSGEVVEDMNFQELQLEVMLHRSSQKGNWQGIELNPSLN